MSNSTIYFRALVSCMQNAYIFFFTLGIYFVYIPWNLERLQLAETDLGLWLFIFGVVNLISNQITGRIIVPKIGTKSDPKIWTKNGKNTSNISGNNLAGRTGKSSKAGANNCSRFGRQKWHQKWAKQLPKWTIFCSKFVPKMAPVLGTKDGTKNCFQICQNWQTFGKKWCHFCPPKLEPKLALGLGLNI